ncbi:MAG: hypothetical protein WCB68_03655 [Pyrinomonadaceae bacterium]
MNRNKCKQCSLVNLASDQVCRRCGEPLGETSETSPDAAGEGKVKKRGILRRLLWITGTTCAILFVWYASLIISSERLGFDERQEVYRATEILDQKGFGKEAFALRHLVTYRGTDNWWNKYVGHRDAYAATNFPFEVVTLYPEFFKASADDNERAAMLLHEAYHLYGHAEEAALEGVWRDKQRLGWTEDKYGHSQVWDNTKELTRTLVPKLFSCGADAQSDCTQ